MKKFTEKEKRKRGHLANKANIKKRAILSPSIQNIRRKILLAYNNECALCKWNIKKYKKTTTNVGVEIHHITSVMSNGETSFNNCIVLCPNCHKLADLEIITKDQLQKHKITDEYTVIKTIKSIHNQIIR